LTGNRQRRKRLRLVNARRHGTKAPPELVVASMAAGMPTAPPTRMKKLTAIFLALAVACSGDKLTDPQRPAVEGTWTLQSIGGLGLPDLLGQSGCATREMVVLGMH